jgi:hypothetical protein
LFGRRRRRKKKALQERISEAIRAEFAGIVAALERDRQEYLRRLELKRETRSAFEEAQAEARRLHSERVALKKGFWKAYYEQDEALLSDILARSGRLERAAGRAEKALKKARAASEGAEFDEAGEGFALKAKADVAEEEIRRRLGSLEKGLGEVLAGLRGEVEEAAGRLREAYEEPSFESAEEREAHVGRMIEVLNEVSESYAPGEEKKKRKKKKKR